MTDQAIKTAYERDGYVVVKDIIDNRDLDPIRDFIKAKVDAYSDELYSEDPSHNDCSRHQSVGGNYRRAMKTNLLKDGTPRFVKNWISYLATGLLVCSDANSTISTIVA